nr:hypothetical protein B0A51_08935 [Rachicladosporium sp. CCFEE 5018]
MDERGSEAGIEACLEVGNLASNGKSPTTGMQTSYYCMRRDGGDGLAAVQGQRCEGNVKSGRGLSQLAQRQGQRLSRRQTLLEDNGYDTKGRATSMIVEALADEARTDTDQGRATVTRRSNNSDAAVSISRPLLSGKSSKQSTDKLQTDYLILQQSRPCARRAKQRWSRVRHAEWSFDARVDHGEGRHAHRLLPTSDEHDGRAIVGVLRWQNIRNTSTPASMAGVAAGHADENGRPAKRKAANDGRAERRRAKLALDAPILDADRLAEYIPRPLAATTRRSIEIMRARFVSWTEETLDRALGQTGHGEQYFGPTAPAPELATVRAFLRDQALGAQGMYDGKRLPDRASEEDLTVKPVTVIKYSITLLLAMKNEQRIDP